ncbi:MAG: hypothetical protein AAB432_02280 [Patescibacteria group bacterium]
MKRNSLILTCFLTLSLFFNETAEGQRNRTLMSRPFEWQMIRGDHYMIYFPKQTETIARKVAKEIPTILKLYSEKIFVTERPINVPKDTLEKYRYTSDNKLPKWLTHRPFISDTLGNVIYKKLYWLPETLVIVLYPNMQDFGEQRIVDEFFPPGVLGFTEYGNNRIALPYSGNDHEFKATLSHEIAHACQNLFVKDESDVADKLGLPNNSRPRYPLWFSEGFAEFSSSDIYMDSLGEQSDYRRYRTEEINLELTVNEKIPSLEELKYNGGFLVYTMGYEFLRFMAKRFAPDSISNLMKKTARNEDFEKAWLHTFKEPLLTSETEWWKKRKVLYDLRTLFEKADKLPQEKIESDSIQGIKELEIIGKAGFDPKTRTIVFYEPKKKWGINVASFSFDDTDITKSKIEIDHQFANKSLWYRLNNPPAVFGDRVLITLSGVNQNYIRIFELQRGTDGERTGVELKEEITIPGILWVKDFRFESEDLFYFVGMDTLGEENIYSYSILKKELSKLTNTSVAKEQPGIFDQKLVYIASGNARDEHFLCIEEKGEVSRVSFSNERFVDQWIADSSWIIVKVLTDKAIPDLIFWPKGSSFAYRYKYGNPFYGDTGINYVRYPFVSQLLGFSSDGKFIVRESKTKDAENGRFVVITLDTSLLEKIEVKIIKGIPQSAQFINDTSKVEPPNDSYKYRGDLPFDNIFGIDFPGMGKTNATGEKGMEISMLLDRRYAYQHMGVRWFDFSKRLRKETGLGVTGQLRVRRSPESGQEELIKGGILELKRSYSWPFDLENSITLMGGVGFYAQQPPDITVRDTTKKDSLNCGIFGCGDTLKTVAQPAFLHSTVIRLEAKFVSDGSFVDFFRSTKHGHYLAVNYGVIKGFLGALHNTEINTEFDVDLRYYFRPWQARPYLATRVFYGISTGYGPYAFFNPDLYRKPGFYRFNWSKSFGNKVFLYNLEARFPLFRFFMTNYEFWEHERPWWFFSFQVAPFFSGGDIKWLGEPFSFVNRFGFACKMSLFSWAPAYLRYEYYKYLDEQPWQSAMTFEFEY